MKKNLVERVSGGANINSTVDLRQSSRYIIGSLLLLSLLSCLRMIKKIAWYLALGSTCAHPLSRRRGRFALKNGNVEGNERYEYDNFFVTIFQQDLHNQWCLPQDASRRKSPQGTFGENDHLSFDDRLHH